MKKKNLSNWIIALILSMTVFGLASCEKDDPKSNIAGIIAFGFSDAVVSDYTFSIDQTNRTITNNDVLPYGTDVTALKAVFEPAELAIVTVNEAEQVSGVTVNDFSQPVTYTVTAEDGVTVVNYTVTVNVSQINPDEVSWNQVVNAAPWSPLKYSAAIHFGGKLWSFGSVVLPFSNFNSYLYSSVDGVNWTEETATTIDGEARPIPPVEYTNLIIFKDELYFVAGFEPGRQFDGGYTFNRVTKTLWKTSNGLDWTIIEPVDAWPARERTSALVHDNKLWIIGGNGTPPFGQLAIPMGDVWSSSDGINWTQATDMVNYQPRTWPATFVYDGKMYVSGGNTTAGNNPPNMLNDLWHSTDGATWTEVNVESPYTPRWGHKIVVYGDRLFLIGGESDRTGQAVLSDLWVSEDGGVNWRQVTEEDPEGIPSNFKARTEHSMFVDEDGDFWIIGGKTLNNQDGFATYLNDVWKGRLSILE